MAITDFGNYLSCKQVLDETKIAYAQRYIDFQSSTDIGQTANPLYVKFVAHGAFTKGLKIELAMANKADFTDAVAVNALEVVQTDLKKGWYNFIKVPAIGKKFRYLSVKYTPTGAVTESTDKHEPICPSEPVLREDKEIEKAISAFISTVDDFDTTYHINV